MGKHGFFRQRQSDIQYIKQDLAEIFPILSKADCLVSLPISDIFNYYKKSSLGKPLVDETHEEWETHTGLNIKVYELINGKIVPEGLISTGGFEYDQTVYLVAENPDNYDQVCKIINRNLQ